MYCQSCGTEIKEGLNYCNRCGAQVVSLAAAQGERVAFGPADVAGPVRWLAVTIILTLLISLIILFTAIGHLTGRGVTGDPIIVISAVGLAGIFAVELSLIRIMSRLLFEGREQQAKLPAARKSDAAELRPAPAQQFIQPAAATGPVHSVTDHTTRTLAEAFREPRA